MSAIVIGSALDDKGAAVLDLPTLVESRMLIQGTSGSGKSRLLRVLCEQAFGKVQVIVIDPEGEFSTLREKYDYMLAGTGGEVPAAPRSAGLLARRLRELRVSAVIDVYDLTRPERRSFVRQFLESLIEGPKELHRPMLLVIDEAHLFAPEAERDVESTAAVIEACSRGRKRGVCPILATQRLSKLHKDAAAECMNVFIGRTVLDVDQTRAADALGFGGRADKVALRDLDPGVFLAFGPALSATGRRGVTRILGADVVTRHPQVGQRHKIEPPAPSAAILKVATELRDLPAQADEEARTIAQAQARIRALEREVREAQRARPRPEPVAQPKRVEVPMLRRTDLDRVATALVSATTVFAEGIRRVEAAAKRLDDGVVEPMNKLLSIASLPVPASAPAREAPAPRHAAPLPVPERGGDNGGSGSMRGTGGGLYRMLLALHDRKILTRRQLGVRAGLASNSGTFRTYLGKGRAEGRIGEQGDRLAITDAGAQEVMRHPFVPLPVGSGLLAYWVGELPGKAKDMLSAIAAVYPEGLTRAEIGERVGIAHDAGTFRTYLGKLRTLELVEGKDTLKASAELFD